MKPLIGHKNTTKFDKDNNANVGLKNFIKLKAEFESMISFVIAKSLIAKIFSTILNCRLFSLFRSENRTAWQIIKTWDKDSIHILLTNSPLKHFKKSSLGLNTVDEWPFVLRLPKDLFMKETLDKGQVNARLIILCFAIKFLKVEQSVLFHEMYCFCEIWSFFGSLQ